MGNNGYQIMVTKSDLNSKNTILQNAFVENFKTEEPLAFRGILLK
jgi:hypothetical protein